MIADTEPCSKQCYRCDKPVRMSFPEFTRYPQNWTVCKICRDTLAIEAKEIGPIAALRAKEAKSEAAVFGSKINDPIQQEIARERVEMGEKP